MGGTMGRGRTDGSRTRRRVAGEAAGARRGHARRGRGGGMARARRTAYGAGAAGVRRRGGDVYTVAAARSVRVRE
jgi:hypothetical protein